MKTLMRLRSQMATMEPARSLNCRRTGILSKAMGGWSFIITPEATHCRQHFDTHCLRFLLATQQMSVG